MSMDADVRIDPDGTTWIRVDYNGQAYWLNKELTDPGQFIPPAAIRFDEPDRHAWTRPDYRVVQSVASKWLGGTA